MNPDLDVRKSIGSKEFDELRYLVNEGNRNFSRKTLESAEFLHPLNEQRVGVPSVHSAISNYVFECGICSQLPIYPSWYEIILDTVGGTVMNQKKSYSQDLESGWNGKNLSKIQKEDNHNYQMSSVNHRKDYGYVCDHCNDSCFDD